MLLSFAFLMLNMKCFVPKYCKISAFWKKWELCMIALICVDINFGTNPSACLENNVQYQFCSCPVTCPVVVWNLSAYLLTFSMLIWLLSVFLKSALNQSMRYLERTASDLPVCQPVQFNLNPALDWRLILFFSSLFFALQNKVLAVIEAIEAAQYVISHNATHLINRVKNYFFS